VITPYLCPCPLLKLNSSKNDLHLFSANHIFLFSLEINHFSLLPHRYCSCFIHPGLSCCSFNTSFSVHLAYPIRTYLNTRSLLFSGVLVTLPHTTSKAAHSPDFLQGSLFVGVSLFFLILELTKTRLCFDHPSYRLVFQKIVTRCMASYNISVLATPKFPSLAKKSLEP
jgi:hypothetical protein